MKNKYSLIATGLFLALGTAQGACMNGTYNSPAGFTCIEKK